MAQRSIKLTNAEINNIASIIANSMLQAGPAKIGALSNLSGEAAAEKFATVFANEIKALTVSHKAEFEANSVEATSTIVAEVRKTVVGTQAVQKYMQDHKIAVISKVDEVLIEKAIGNIRADIYKAYKSSTADDAFIVKFAQITGFQVSEDIVEKQAKESVALEEPAEKVVVIENSDIDQKYNTVEQDQYLEQDQHNEPLVNKNSDNYNYLDPIHLTN